MAEISNLATLGIVVDASGAQRQIKLTTEQLKALANGGKEAQAVMKNLTPPAVVQSMERTTQAVKKAAAAQSANVQATVKAGASLNGLREPLTSLTRSLLGLNPAVAQFSSVLGSFSIGSGPMVGILAGIAALGFAWDQLTSKARNAERETADAIVRLQEVQRKQRQGDFGTTPEDIAKAWDKVLSVTREIRNLEASRAAVPGAVGRQGLTGLDATVEIAARQAAIDSEIATRRDRQAKLLSLIRSGNAKVAEVNKDHLEEMAREREIQLDKERKAWEQHYRGLLDIERAAAARRNLNAAAINLLGGDSVSVAGKTADYARINAERAAATRKEFDDRFAAMYEYYAAELREIRRVAAERKAALKDYAISSGLGLLSAHGGVAGGIIAAGAGGFMQTGGNPWGVAVGAGTALVNTLFSMSSAARQAAENLKQMRTSLTDTVLSWRAELGLPGADKALGASRIHQQAQSARDALNALFPGITGVLSGNYNQAAKSDYQKQLDEINKLEQQRIDNLGKEKSAIDGLNDSMVNMVQGYRLQSTIFSASNPRGRGTGGITPRGYATAGGGENLTVNVVMDGRTVGTAVLQDFRRRSAQNGGNGLDWERVR